MPFKPEDHLIKLQGKEYLEVKWRLVWFRQECPNGTIETQILQFDPDKEVEEEVMVWNDEKKRKEKVMKRGKGYCVFHAVVKDGNGGIGSGTKSETSVGFPDYLEKAESGSIGRALATLGYGTQFTGDELSEGVRIVDAPVDRVPAEVQPLQARARKLGLAKDVQEWGRYKESVLKHEVLDRDLDRTQISALSSDLTRRERVVERGPVTV